MFMVCSFVDGVVTTSFLVADRRFDWFGAACFNNAVATPTCTLLAGFYIWLRVGEGDAASVSL
jgi:hypothetical protein